MINKIKKVLKDILFLLLFFASYWIFEKCVQDSQRGIRVKADKEMMDFYYDTFRLKKIQGVDRKNQGMKFYDDEKTYNPFLFTNKIGKLTGANRDDTIEKPVEGSFILISKGKRYLYVVDTNFMF
jgi:hypothetical protein